MAKIVSGPKDPEEDSNLLNHLGALFPIAGQYIPEERTSQKVAEIMLVDVETAERELELLRDEFSLVDDREEQGERVWKFTGNRIVPFVDIEERFTEIGRDEYAWMYEDGVFDENAYLDAACSALELFGCPVCGHQPDVVGADSWDMIWLDDCSHSLHPLSAIKIWESHVEHEADGYESLV